MKPNRTHGSFRTPRAGITGLLVATLFLGAVPAPVRAASTSPLLTIPNVPWFIGQNVSPNILLTIDDSGSMQWAYAPDGVGDKASNGSMYRDTIAFKSNLNPMYYNENVTYAAPPKADDTLYSTSYTQAWRNGFDISRGSVNLATGYFANYQYNPSLTTGLRANHCQASEYVGGKCPGTNVNNLTATEAYWWVYRAGSSTNCPASPTYLDWANLPASCFDFKRATTPAQQQNFANWYSFYRTRNLAVISATMLAFSKMPSDYRVAWQGVGGCNGVNFTSNCIGWDSSRAGVNAKIGLYTAAKRQALWTWLERLPTAYPTLVRSAVIRSGEYLKLTGAGSPYADDPSANSNITYTSCRPSYNITLTDGIWDSDIVTNIGNADNTSRTLPDGRTYTPAAPFKDTNSNSLADIAFTYWATDLQPSLANTVRPFMPYRSGPLVSDAEYWDPRNDPTTWQNMTSIFMGFSLSSWLNSPAWAGSTYAGQASPATGYQQFKQGLANWPLAQEGAIPGNVYDLWHAAINSRGQFYGADSPDALVKAFDDLRSRISQRQAGASAAGGTSLQVQADSTLFSASFNSERWDGTLRAYKVNPDGTTDPNPLWSTDSTFNHLANGAIGTHKVYTRSANGGRMQLLPTTISSLPTARQNELAAQVAALNQSLSTPIDSARLIRWVLGDESNTELRRRERLLGDVVNSSPMSESGRDYGYAVTAWTDSPKIDGKPYADYVKTKYDSSGGALKPTVYIGSNDGMLHAFNGQTGAHRWAWMPSPSFAKLRARADPVAAHQWSVDGAIVSHDIHMNGAWRTILVASTGAGARGLFALDVTDPDDPSLLWEWFPDDDDIGFITGEPVVARAASGDWIVATGNGYGSVSNKSMLVVLNAATGSVIRKFEVPQQTVTDANGMSSPALLYAAGKRLVSAYAGDLRGYLWKFDLASADSSAWKVGFSNRPLFRAVGPDNVVQPITAKIRIASDRQLGRVLLFGTGRLLSQSDPTSTDKQSIYGIFDRDDSLSTVTRANLTEQTITNESGSLRTVSTNTLTPTGTAGWYLDLTGRTSNVGERVVMPVNYMPELSLMTVATIRPTAAADPCGSNVTSWVLAMSPFTGGGFALFDGGNSFGAGWRLDDIIASPTPVRQGTRKVVLNFNAGAAGLAQIQMKIGWNPRASWTQVR